jgi:hypothetical protein
MKVRKIITVLVLFAVLFAAACASNGTKKPSPRPGDLKIDENGTITAWEGTGTEIVIPARIGRIRVTAIGDGVFKKKKLTGVILPKGLIFIGNNAFEDNVLETIIIPDSVTFIGENAFFRNHLDGITLSAGLTSISDGAFRSNYLSSVTIPEGVTRIGDEAFDLNRIRAITIPDSVTSIGDEAFHLNRIRSITIPDSVKSIGKRAFANSRRMRSITIGANVALARGLDGLGDNFHSSFRGDFDYFYEFHGMKAGTYVYNDEQ